MNRRLVRFLSILLAGCACQLALTGVAHAEVSLSATGYRVSSTAAQVTVTVNRTGSLRGDEYVRYGTHRANAVDGIDYQNVGGTLHFLPGQAQATFTIPIVARDWRGPSVHAAVYLYGSFPEKLGPHNAKLFILHNAPLETRDPANPLELAGVPNAAGNLLAGARFYADPHHSPAAEAARRLRRKHPKEAGLIQAIADQPFTDRFGSWNGRQPRRRRLPVPAQRRRPGPGVGPHPRHLLDRQRPVRPGRHHGLPQPGGRLSAVHQRPVGRDRQLPRGRVPGDGLADHHPLPARARARGAHERTALCRHHAGTGPARARVRRRRRRRRALVQDCRPAPDPRRRAPGPGVLPQLHPFRLDHVGDRLRAEARSRA